MSESLAAIEADAATLVHLRRPILDLALGLLKILLGSREIPRRPHYAVLYLFLLGERVVVRHAHRIRILPQLHEPILSGYDLVLDLGGFLHRHAALRRTTHLILIHRLSTRREPEREDYNNNKTEKHYRINPSKHIVGTPSRYCLYF